jgi:hypothetical protein
MSYGIQRPARKQITHGGAKAILLPDFFSFCQEEKRDQNGQEDPFEDIYVLLVIVFSRHESIPETRHRVHKHLLTPPASSLLSGSGSTEP